MEGIRVKRPRIVLCGQFPRRALRWDASPGMLDWTLILGGPHLEAVVQEFLIHNTVDHVEATCANATCQSNRTQVNARQVTSTS